MPFLFVHFLLRNFYELRKYSAINFYEVMHVYVINHIHHSLAPWKLELSINVTNNIIRAHKIDGGQICIIAFQTGPINMPTSTFRIS